MATTRKKVKVVGTETYINQKTGELQEMQVIDIENAMRIFTSYGLDTFFSR